MPRELNIALFSTCTIIIMHRSKKKWNVDVKVVSVIDLSTFLKLGARSPYWRLQWLFLTYTSCILQVIIVALRKKCLIFFAPFPINQKRFLLKKRELILAILMCHSLSFSFFVYIHLVSIHLRLFIFMSCKKSHQKIFSHCKWKRRKFLNGECYVTTFFVAR